MKNHRLRVKVSLGSPTVVQTLPPSQFSPYVRCNLKGRINAKGDDTA